MLEEEIRLSDSANQQLADLHAHCALEITQLRESLQNTKVWILEIKKILYNFIIFRNNF